MKKTKWLSTVETVERTGLSRNTLYRLIKDKTLKKGTHYRVVNPKAKRLTYQFNQDMMDFYGQK